MRPLVQLVGATARERAAICLLAGSERMKVEPVASVAALTPQAVSAVDAFLAWDEGRAVAQLKAHLSILAHRAPIIALAEKPSVRQVVAALVAGAVDFVEWPCSAEDLHATVASAIESSARMHPLKLRAIEARRQLQQLTRRERQVLTAMAQGMSNKTIAGILEIEARAVESHRRALLDKLGVEHSAEAIRLELEASLSPEWSRQSDWMAPWMIDSPITRTG